jgi:F-box-like
VARTVVFHAIVESIKSWKRRILRRRKKLVQIDIGDIQEENSISPHPDPLSILPPELFIDILSLLCDGSPKSIRNLLKVSTSWYKSVCDAPQLWSTITVNGLRDDLQFDCGPRDGLGVERTMSFLKCSLSRSKSALLDISLGWDNDGCDGPGHEEENNGTRIVQCLMGQNNIHCKRWRSLMWSETWPTLGDAMAILPPLLPSLQRLKLADISIYSKRSLCPFPCCPALRCLEIVRFDDFCAPVLQHIDHRSLSILVFEPRFQWTFRDLRRLDSFGNLQALTIRTGNPVEILCGFIELLESCHNGIEGVQDPAQLQPIHFPRLRELHIECRRRPHLATILFALFRAPALKHLEFRSIWWWGDLRYVGDLLNFAHHAHHLLDTIEVLKLDLHNAMSELLEYEVIHFLHQTRSLRELHLGEKLHKDLGKRVHDEARKFGWLFKICP